MTPEQQTCAQECLDAAFANSMSFPAIVGRLMDAGFESYAVDFRRSTAVYYLPSGDNIELPLASDGEEVSPYFHTVGLKAAIKDAQAGVPGYTYNGFCQQVKAAGCAGYIVSFLGHRAVYFGRTGETHVEPFPTSDG